uniref:Uncharacterized protein n=1 Tax=Chromera velia CCMP2878 TaxID=1169474 RepID=A0A0G4H619_9ALVE|eukprot:Cvel_24830.t1-p1 / transcript=Cvel_24830.t1 / gene=Cvel_24830 / organism=Chromera_velia_CCMP2878 / gene_product=Endoplasmic reticulum metallopeptidase 1, putative / transcript_product=Endoplasmic reticulum metallopeptidase 1, putative / location=Cvel_scaffold2738:6442-18602(+) / protein_length=1064 / sequence_SO=supercontig / SO=protein_coding / is_pseudo=false
MWTLFAFRVLWVALLSSCTVFLVRRLYQTAEPVDDAPLDTFSEGRTRAFLNQLSGLGPKEVGTIENEETAVNLIVDEVKSILASAKFGDMFHTEISVKSDYNGTLFVPFLHGTNQVYTGHTNVAIKLTPKTADPEAKAILVASHYDSAFGSPAGADANSMCAIMLETLRNLLNSSEEKLGTQLQFPIIFNFNGGEEPILMASHGFVAQHPWVGGEGEEIAEKKTSRRKNVHLPPPGGVPRNSKVRVLLNLEAAGSGGKEIIFQAGPGVPWVLRAYGRAVSSPCGLSLAQDVFELKIFPGDTDYRVFRDYGGMRGLDFAWANKGWVYHTSRDVAENVDKGSIQRYGDNLLALIRELQRDRDRHFAQGSEDPDDDRAALWFDVAGLFLVVLTKDFVFHYLLPFVVVLKVIALARTRLSVLGLMRAAWYQIWAIVRALVSGVLAGGLVFLGGADMFWLSRLHLAALLYAPLGVHAVLHCLKELQQRLERSRVKEGRSFPLAVPKSLWESEELKTAMAGVVVTWSILLYAASYFRLGSVYIPFLFVSSGSVLLLGLSLGPLPKSTGKGGVETKEEKKREGSSKGRGGDRGGCGGVLRLLCVVLGCLGLAFSFAIMMGGALLLLSAFLPVTSRAGEMPSSPDLVIGPVCSAVSALLFIGSLPLALVGLSSKSTRLFSPLVLLAPVLCGLVLLLGRLKEEKSGPVWLHDAEKKLPVQLREFIWPTGAGAGGTYEYWKPKRLFLVHMHRRFFSEDGILEHQDSGLSLAPVDFRGLRDLSESLESLGLFPPEFALQSSPYDSIPPSASSVEPAGKEDEEKKGQETFGSVAYVKQNPRGFARFPCDLRKSCAFEWPWVLPGLPPLHSIRYVYGEEYSLLREPGASRPLLTRAPSAFVGEQTETADPEAVQAAFRSSGLNEETAKWQLRSHRVFSTPLDEDAEGEQGRQRVVYWNEYNPETNRTRLDVAISAGAWSIVRFSAENLLAWSVSDPMPKARPACNCHQLMYAGGRGPYGFLFSLELEGKVGRTLQVTTHNFSGRTSSQKRVMDALPPWTDAVTGIFLTSVVRVPPPP